MSKVPNNTTTRSTTDLPTWAQPSAQRYLQENFDYYLPGGQYVPYDPATNTGGRIEGGGIRQYDGPDRTILGFNDQELAAQDAQRAYLLGGNLPGMEQVTSLMNETLSGKYLDPSTNPYVKSTYDAAADAVTKQYRDAVAPGQAANAAMAGAYGGSASANEQLRNQYGMGKNLSDLATQIYGQNYQQERQYQNAAAQFMPQFGQFLENFNLNRLDRMNALGANRRQLEQQQQDVGYENAMTRFEYPMKVLQYLGQGLGTGATGSASSTTGPNPNANNAVATYGGLGIAGAGTLINGYNGWNEA